MKSKSQNFHKKYVMLKLMLKLTNQQIEKLSDLFMDLGKGLILASFTAPILTSIDFVIFLKLSFGGILCVYFSLSLVKAEG